MSKKDRSKRFGIEALANSPEEHESEHPSSAYGDPVNLSYLILTKESAEVQKSRFLSDAKSKVYRHNNSLGVIESRINRLCRKYGVQPLPVQSFSTDSQQVCNILSTVQLFDTEQQAKKVIIPATRNASFFHPAYGHVVFDDDLFDSFMDNWASNVVGTDLIINAEHGRNGMLGGMALGWIDNLYSDNGVFFISAKPTATGSKVIGEEYRYASIEYMTNFVDQETGVSYGPTLVGCAVTNVPFVHRNQPVSVNSFGKEELMDEKEEIVVQPHDVEVGMAKQPDAIELESIKSQLASMAEEREAIKAQLRQAKIEAAITEAAGRGVAPAVLSIAGQLMSQCDLLAEKTLTLDFVSGGKGEKFNFFEAIEALLKKAPGREFDQVTVPAQPLENSRDKETKMTLEQAEAAAMARRKKLNINVV